MKIVDKFIFLVFLLFTFSCGNDNSETNNGKDTTANSAQTDTAQVVKEEKNPNQPDKVVKEYDELAQFLAGIQPDSNSKYAKYAQDNGWVNYKSYADNTWTKINTGKLPIVSAWRDKELKEANDASGTVFYPFSGADFLHVNIFFPNADNYVMIGLEPIGSIPDLEKVRNLRGYFNGIRHTLYAIMELSFFRTIAMAQDFTGKVEQNIDGTLPVLLLFMARTNHEILNIEKVAIDSEGNLVLAKDFQGDKNTLYGNKIYFVNKDNPEKFKTLCYFQANIDNQPYNSRSGFSSVGLDERTDLNNYLNKLNITTTYIKSASYLMHRDHFSKIRDIVLTKSQYYLQDDSGVPVRYFEEKNWDLTFYGSYYAPISLFAVRLQKDLRAIYQQKEKIKELPFGIGYQYQKGTSNLMFGKKK